MKITHSLSVLLALVPSLFANANSLDNFETSGPSVADIEDVLKMAQCPDGYNLKGTYYVKPVITHIDLKLSLIGITAGEKEQLGCREDEYDRGEFCIATLCTKEIVGGGALEAFKDGLVEGYLPEINDGSK